MGKEQSEVIVKVVAGPEAEGLPLPEFMTPGAAAADLRAAVREPITIGPGEWAIVTTGLRLEIPPGYEGQVRPRSGLSAKFGVTLLNSPGTIDADYRGVVQVILVNHGRVPFTVQRGDRIAQLVVAPVQSVRFVRAETLAVSERSEGGFGHTGLQ